MELLCCVPDIYKVVRAHVRYLFFFLLLLLLLFIFLHICFSKVILIYDRNVDISISSECNIIFDEIA
jgi:hypothetical protein